MWSRGANWRLLYKHGFSLTETGVEEYGEPKYGALAWAGIGISFRAQPCSQGSLLPVY